MAFVDDQEQVEGYVRYIAETPEPDGSIPVGIELVKNIILMLLLPKVIGG